MGGLGELAPRILAVAVALDPALRGPDRRDAEFRRGVGPAAATDFVVVGLLVIALAAYEMWQVGNGRERGS
jgi:hypothetical protein